MKSECITNNSLANDQLLYFTSSSLTKDGKLIFISDRTNHPNLFVKEIAKNKVKQLTFNDNGYLKSYVYFDGNEYKGLGKASISLDPERGNIYYIEGKKICRVNIHGEKKVLAEYEKGQMTAFTHVSSDGRKLCVPTTDARALDADKLVNGRPNYNIDQRVQDENLSSYLNIYDTNTGELIRKEEVPKSWITHVQFSPKDNDLILYNHEWPSNCGIRRIWLWNGEKHIQVRRENMDMINFANKNGKQKENNVIRKKDWVCHEMWEKSGEGIIYHGGYKDGTMFIGRLDINSFKLTEISLANHYTAYGHFTVGSKGLLVSDGYYQEQNKNLDHGKWISLQKIDWEKGDIEWIPLLKHHSSWNSQDSHPHPIFDHYNKYIYYNSDLAGERNIYRVKVDVKKKNILY